MSAGRFSLRLPEPLMREAKYFAKKDNVSLNQWISKAVARRIATAEPAEEFFKRRSAGATGIGLRAILDRVPHAPPVPGDELPEDLKHLLKKK